MVDAIWNHPFYILTPKLCNTPKDKETWDFNPSVVSSTVYFRSIDGRIIIKKDNLRWKTVRRLLAIFANGAGQIDLSWWAANVVKGWQTRVVRNWGSSSTRWRWRQDHICLRQCWGEDINFKMWCCEVCSERIISCWRHSIIEIWLRHEERWSLHDRIASEADIFLGGDYLGFGFGGFGRPVVSYAPRPILTIGTGVEIMLYMWFLSDAC